MWQVCVSSVDEKEKKNIRKRQNADICCPCLDGYTTSDSDSQDMT